MTTSRKPFPYRQIIVVGGTGQTGHRVLELLMEFDGLTCVATSRRVEGELPAGELAGTILGDARKWGAKIQWRPLDLESEPGVLEKQLHVLGGDLSANVPTALIVAAAYTNVEGCETDQARCERVNETNTAAVLAWAKREFGAKLVFYSTDYVFDGAAGPYLETTRRHAESRYGQAKVFMEEWVEKYAPDALVLRTTGVYDYLPGSKNFLMQMLELWGQGKPTRIPSDQFSNPVCARDLARATVELLARGAKGIYHAAGGTYLARTEFAAQIARVFGYDEALITGIRTAELNQKARRPLKGGLRCEKLKSELGWAPGGAQEVLESLKWLHRR